MKHLDDPENLLKRVHAVGVQVRLTPAYLESLTPAAFKRLNGRIGSIHGYRMGAREPIVVFPRQGRLPEIKLIEVSPRDLEVVLVPAGT